MALPKFFDPHFHHWDTTGDAPNVDPTLIGPPAALHPVYTADMLKDDLSAVCELIGAVHVEALANDGLAEAREVAAADSSVPVVMVPRVDLSHEEAPAHLATLMKEHGADRVKGIRMILNWEPSWPKVDRADYLTSEDFGRGYAALADHGLSFDLQANPHQLKAAAALAAKHSNIPVIINHFGTLKLGREDVTDEAGLEEWREGMRALAAAGDHVFLKISMLCYTHKDWDKASSGVPALVEEMLALFGPERCMFASNYPVDKADDVDPAQLFAGFNALAAGLAPEARENLYFRTAQRAYRTA